MRSKCDANVSADTTSSFSHIINGPILRKMKVSWTYFTWGPNSLDTGGILEDDWHMARVDKLTALQPIMYPQFQCAPSTPISHLETWISRMY